MLACTGEEFFTAKLDLLLALVDVRRENWHLVDLCDSLKHRSQAILNKLSRYHFLGDGCLARLLLFKSIFAVIVNNTFEDVVLTNKYLLWLVFNLWSVFLGIVTTRSFLIIV